jgi:hypothetical protein
MDTLRSKWFRRATALLTIMTFASLALFLATYDGEKRVYAQATYPTGFYAAASNAVVNTAIGSGGAVTNPASNFLMLVQGSTIYCGGSAQTIAQSTIQLAASNTYLIVWNCITEALYAKTAVTGPGSPSPNQPGVPATILAPVPGVEIPLATVVCGTTNCGNTGNGTITDARPVAAFPGAGMPFNTTLQANLPTTNVTNGTMIFCTDCTTASACTGSGTGAMAFRQNGAWKCF